MERNQIKIHQYAQDIALNHPILKGVQEKLGVVLVGSRSVGYAVPSSDFDFLVVCEDEIFREIALRAGKDQNSKGINLPLEKDQIKRDFGVDVDLAVFNLNRITKAFKEYKDIVLWIWLNAKCVVDPKGIVSTIQNSFKGYPKDVLEQKLKNHFLYDFHLSVHGITYRYESQNIFSVAYTLACKVAAFCRLCCLLDGKPFPYEKWLLEECKRTMTGQQISPLLEQVITIITMLDGDLEKNSDIVKKAVYTLDTEACDLLEKALISWGIEGKWIENASGFLPDVIFE